MNESLALFILIETDDSIFPSVQVTDEVLGILSKVKLPLALASPNDQDVSTNKDQLRTQLPSASPSTLTSLLATSLYWLAEIELNPPELTPFI